ncbi:hypothetical protein GMO_26750 [Gluconobacter morbifer G707]|uniref:Uncharacterized protein n=1 Tax=Gluconobacter morbifer G707 TaxID=1088869 RepID=G6XMF7_9PROT|nr:hypothetical protein GMO_26750 [Gluconobacter morbifer G707]
MRTDWPDAAVTRIKRTQGIPYRNGCSGPDASLAQSRRSLTDPLF